MTIFLLQFHTTATLGADEVSKRYMRSLVCATSCESVIILKQKSKKKKVWGKHEEDYLFKIHKPFFLKPFFLTKCYLMNM